MSISPISQQISAKKATKLAVAGAAAGALVSYGLQKRAIRKEQEKANVKGFKKIINWVLDLPRRFSAFVVSKYAQQKEALAKIGKSGKVSKMKVAKTAIITGVTLPILYAGYKLLSRKSNDD